MAKLYELTGIFLEIDEMDVDDETKLDTLDSIDWEHDFSEKIENCIKVIRNKDDGLKPISLKSSDYKP